MSRAFAAIVWVLMFASIVLVLIACRPGPWRRHPRSWFDIPHGQQHAKVQIPPRRVTVDNPIAPPHNAPRRSRRS